MSRDVRDNDAQWRKAFANLKQLEKLEVASGILSKDGSEQHSPGITMVDLATVHEFGTKNIPERSFIRTGYDTHENKIAIEAGKAIDAALLDTNWKAHLNRVGLLNRQGIIDQFKQSGDPKWTKNAPSTIKRKGSDKPLIDTGRLRQSIHFVIRRTEGTED